MKYVILHGTMGSPEGNWFRWLEQELKSKGHDVYVPILPTPEGQNKDNWCTALREQAPDFGSDTVLIGHSSGATFVLHILEVVGEPVAQSFLISPVIDDINVPEYDELNASFVHHDFNWDQIKKNSGKIHIYHGDDDPYVPSNQPELVAKSLDLDVNWIKGGGHLNAETGYTQFPLLLAKLAE